MLWIPSFSTAPLNTASPTKTSFTPIETPIKVFEPDDLTMIIGAATNTALLEIGVATAEGIDFIVHAMSARPRYLGD